MGRAIDMERDIDMLKIEVQKLNNIVRGMICLCWSNVEKTKKVATEQDIFLEYVKIFLYLLAGMAYAYFVILGKTL